MQEERMVRCPECGEEYNQVLNYREGVIVCPKCGAPLLEEEFRQEFSIDEESRRLE
jgi:transcription initiation factor TFIIIB Brf1 subunit/transcription initiation factor TFIIB